MQYQAFYTYSRSMDEKSLISGGESHLEGVTKLDPLNLRRDYARSDSTPEQSFVASATYPFPFPLSAESHGADFGAGPHGISTLRAGAPFTATAGSNRFSKWRQIGSQPSRLESGLQQRSHPWSYPGCAGVPAGQKLGTPQLSMILAPFSLPTQGPMATLEETPSRAWLTNVDM